MASAPRKADPGPSKRKAGPQPQASRGDKSQQRRTQLHVARAVPAQPAEAALKDGELDLQAFMAAHEFEIRSLEQSMATSKASSTSRAFQQVPRGLRRRTASHNPKRVPKRLRSRAVKEMADDNTPTVESRRRKPRTTRARIRAETARKVRILAARKRRKRLKLEETADDLSRSPQASVNSGQKLKSKIRRNLLNDPPRPLAKFRKRQLNKTWLPTHTWHAKRARMTDPKAPLWRFAIPLTPNEKIYRPIHRTQGDRGAVLWDMSYMSTIGLYGNSAGIERVLRRIGVSEERCWNEKGRRWRAGTRSWSGMLSRETKEGRRQMCPSIVLWNPLPADREATDALKKENRQLFLRVHPSAFLEVFNEMLRLVKMETPQLYIEDLRYEIGSIDITGPASTEVLMSVLTPYSNAEHSKTKHAKLFQSLEGLSNPSALPPNTILGFSAQDPRLRHPPRKAKSGVDGEQEIRLLETMAEWPAEAGLRPYEIFDRNARFSASQLPSQKLINRRKSGIPPGTFLKPSLVDPPIPILLLASRSGSASQTQGTWTVLAPWACILPIWYNMIHCPLSSGGNPRAGGLNEIRQVAFERSLPWFPADFVATDAGAEWEAEQRLLGRGEWSRRPKSKRIEWGSLSLGGGRKGEIGDPLACDFEHLFGHSKSQDALPGEQALQTAECQAMDVDGDEPIAVADTTPLRALHLITKQTFDQALSPMDLPLAIAPNTVLCVRVQLLSRGTVGRCARIYRLPSFLRPEPTSTQAEVPATIPPEDSSSTSRALPHDLRSQWLAQLHTAKSQWQCTKTPKPPKSGDIESRKRALARELIAEPAASPPSKSNTTDIGGHPLVPNADDLIGFITSGSYSLSEGRGMGVGSIAVEKVLPGVRGNAKEGHICIVRNSGENIGWIARWEAI